jgi:hypothetical protein
MEMNFYDSQLQSLQFLHVTLINHQTLLLHIRSSLLIELIYSTTIANTHTQTISIRRRHISERERERERESNENETNHLEMPLESITRVYVDIVHEKINDELGFNYFVTRNYWRRTHT